jgi:small subunit ribosomal protein S8
MTDPIADMLTRIRNASMVRKSEVLVPFSKIKFEIAKVLEKEKYIGKVELDEQGFKSLKISLKYENKKSVINTINRVSKVGRRMYVAKDKIRPVLNGYGVAILSTSKGVMADHTAQKIGVGGEILCEVY